MSSSFLPRTPPAVLSSSNAMTAPLWDDCPNLAFFPVREAYSPTLMVSLCREHDVTSSAPIASTEVRNVFMRVKTDARVHSTAKGWRWMLQEDFLQRPPLCARGVVRPAD